jgi:methylenetetrahydrofolate dehydrogenase (NADP+)/methenyltetrahydrofolate cyclohydrolase
MTDPQPNTLLDGKSVAAAIRREVAEEVAQLPFAPRLDVILVGDDPASQVYVRSKGTACEKAGITSVTHRLEATVSQEEIIALIDRLNGDPEVDGILVQLPLPAGIESEAVLDRLDPDKDVDGFHPINVGRLQQRRPFLVPCTPAGIMELLRRERIELAGRRAVVLGRSDIVGKPMAMLLLHANATVTVCHSRTRDLPSVTREADVLIAAVGQKAMVTPELVRPGTVVVDVGIHRVDDVDEVRRLFPDDPGRMETFERRGAVVTGDVDFARVAPVAGRITPVPGGVGPLTIAMLLSNTVRAARARRE